MATHTYFTRAVDDIAAQNGVRYSTSRAFSVSPELKRLAAYKLKKVVETGLATGCLP